MEFALDHVVRFSKFLDMLHDLPLDIGFLLGQCQQSRHSCVLGPLAVRTIDQLCLGTGAMNGRDHLSGLRLLLILFYPLVNLVVKLSNLVLEGVLESSLSFVFAEIGLLSRCQRISDGKDHTRMK